MARAPAAEERRRSRRPDGLGRLRRAGRRAGRVMRFLPHTPGDIARMLGAVGKASVDDLFATVPAALRESASIRLDPGVGEREVLDKLAELAAANRTPASFQGAGCYRHYVPAAVSAVMARSEF